MPYTPPGPNVIDGDGGQGQGIEEIYRLLESEYGDIDDIFLTDEELQSLLLQAYYGKWKPERFYNAITTSKWFLNNAGKVRQRDYYKRIYNGLIKGLDQNDPEYAKNVEKIAGKTEYWRGLDSVKAKLEPLLTGKGIQYTDRDLDNWAAEIYDSANEDNNSFINRFLNRKVGFGATPLGDVADNLALLKTYAFDMGIDLEKDYRSSLPEWMQRLDRGESIEVFKNIIRDQVAGTEGEFIAGYLNKGMTLKDLYKPYKQYVASELDIPIEEITLDDPLLRQAITQDRFLNNREFKKLARRDPRYQFGQPAREEVYGNMFQILRDFGFQG